MVQQPETNRNLVARGEALTDLNIDNRTKATTETAKPLVTDIETSLFA